jgi:MFS family permease
VRTPSSREPLGTAFRNVFTANLASSLADGIARTAAPLLAVRLTEDPLLVSGVAVAALLPWLLFAIPAGILLDRVDRRRALAVANALRAVLGAGLVALTATGALTIWWLLAVVLAYGALETVYDGAIRAVLPSIVARRDLPRANGRIEGGEIVVQQFLSAPLTSWLLAIAVVVPLAIGATAYAAGAVLALFLPLAAAGAHARRAAPPSGTPDEALDGQPPDGGTARVREPWLHQLLAGYRFVRGHELLWPLWVLSVAIGICHSAATSTYVLFALETLGVPEAWFGTFVLVGAVGGLAGSAVANRLAERFGTGHVMAAANALGLGAWVAAGAAPVLGVAAVSMFVSFGCTVVWNVLVMSLRQSLIPDRMLGRVHGTWRTLLWGAMPLGSLLGGLLARGGLQLPLLVGGGAGLVLALVGYRFLTRLPDPGDVPPTAD